MFLSRPLVLAQKTHDGVEAQIAQTDAIRLGAVHLQRQWEKMVLLEPTAAFQLLAQ